VHKGNNDEAIKDCTEAIRLNPRYALAYLVRGRAYDNKGVHDAALWDRSRAIALDPSLK
jgi:tetratricopeptide (TPR) repeat protein